MDMLQIGALLLLGRRVEACRCWKMNIGCCTCGISLYTDCMEMMSLEEYQEAVYKPVNKPWSHMTSVAHIWAQGAPEPGDMFRGECTCSSYKMELLAHMEKINICIESLFCVCYNKNFNPGSD